MTPESFNPHPKWPTLIVDLCQRIADGEDCRFALHDAWTERGLPIPNGWANDILPPLELGIGRNDGGPKSMLVSMILDMNYKTSICDKAPPFIAKCLEALP